MDRKKKIRSRLWLYFSGVMFVSFFGTLLVILLLYFLFYLIGIVSVNPFTYHVRLRPILTSSLFVGAIMAILVSRVFIRPIRKISRAFEELSRGNFDVKVSTDERILEVREIAERFNAMTYELSHVETLRNDFVVNVSHEFKTPLAAIEGYATLLQNPSLPREKHDYYVEKIIANTHQLSTLSSNILALSKLENQETILHKREYSLDEQLRKAILLLENKWTEKELDLDIDLPGQIFYGNEKLLDQVWFNLLDNAIKHSHPGGTIRVALTSCGKDVTVTIADQGDGMTEEVQKHIFEKFYQGDSSHKAEGNGLGLALVKRITDLCQGTIRVQSEPGKGACFTVTLPNEL